MTLLEPHMTEAEPAGPDRKAGTDSLYRHKGELPVEQTAQSIDNQTTISELRQAVYRFVAARQWEPYHTPKNLAMSIAIEAAELMELFQWLTTEEGYQLLQDPAGRDEAAGELADVLMYCLSFANQANIDISRAIRAKLETNEGRFPVGHTPGDG